MDDPAGGHLSANRCHQSRAGRAEDGNTLQNGEDKGGGGGLAGLDLMQSREKEKGATWAAHRRLKVRAADGLGGGGRCRRLRRPATRVGGEAGRRRPKSGKRPAVGGRCGGGWWWTAGVEEAGGGSTGVRAVWR
jgi:hypothetical protein